MKKTLLVLFCLLLSFNVFSQEKKNRPVQINFGFPLSTINVKKAKEYTNAFSINLLVGISKNERSLALAGIGNVIANSATGLQIASVSNYIGNAGYGIEVAGVTNINKGSYNGIQVSGVYNYSGSGNGIAVAGVANMSKDSYIGLQLSGVINIAGDVKGLQFAGVMNVAKKVKGVQFATILNVAEESNFPIALINIIKNGKMGVAITHDILNNKVLSFRSGGKYSYGILGVGINKKITEVNKLVAEAGYGIHIPVTDWFEINNEFKATTIGYNSEKTTNNFGYFLSPSLTLLEHYNFFAGVSVNYFISNSNDILPENCFWSKDGDYNQRMFIGYQIGVQYVF
jgi:hypothetical protein